MSAQDTPLTPDLHMGNAPRFIAHMMKKSACIVITRDEDGVISMSAHGANHAVANEMLSVGIYSNLSQHYEAVRNGDAGAEAKEMQGEVDHANNQKEEV